jgi:hypothetical protein
MLAGLLKSDEAAQAEEEGDAERALELGVPQLNVSFKPQKISPKFQGTVRQLLHKKIREAYIHPQFISDVMRPMVIDPVIDNEVQTLSGGELQRVAITLCLGTPSNIYLVCIMQLIHSCIHTLKHSYIHIYICIYIYLYTYVYLSKILIMSFFIDRRAVRLPG